MGWIFKLLKVNSRAYMLTPINMFVGNLIQWCRGLEHHGQPDKHVFKSLVRVSCDPKKDLSNENSKSNYCTILKV